MVNGVLRFVKGQEYAGSFGFQWHKHALTQLDTKHRRDSEIGFRNKTHFRQEDLNGKLVLDVGCGMGRFAEVASRWGAHVVGIDLSSAAEVAAANLADRPNVTILQADVFALPFALESFDYIYSIGVLHHTPSCERAFKSLPKLLKPEGKIAVWLYDSYSRWYRMTDMYRHVTHRLPPRLLHLLCHTAGPAYYVYKGLDSIPLAGKRLSSAFNFFFWMSRDPDWHWRVLDTFDWYSPRYQSKHTYEEVFQWFEDSGLEKIRIFPDRIALQGTRRATQPGHPDLPEGEIIDDMESAALHTTHGR